MKQAEIGFLKEAGVLTSEQLSRLEADRKHIEKTAMVSKETLVSYGMPILGALAVSGVSGGLGYLAARNHYEGLQQNLHDSFSELSRDKKVSEDPDKLKVRFSELSLISPTVASNPRLAAQVIGPKLHTGFDLDDVHRLSSIEFHTSNTRRPAHPGDSARRSFGDAMLHQLSWLAPQIMQNRHEQRIREQRKTQQQQRAQQPQQPQQPIPQYHPPGEPPLAPEHYAKGAEIVREAFRKGFEDAYAGRPLSPQLLEMLKDPGAKEVFVEKFEKYKQIMEKRKGSK